MTIYCDNGYADPRLAEMVLEQMAPEDRQGKVKQMIQYHRKKMNIAGISAWERELHEARMAAWIAARISL
jgi:hypothetical protein